MDLKFLGRGSAFNTDEGNNSAYFITNNELFLIDCGETTFERIIKNNVLENIDLINVLITHTHSDHIGSLGSLIMYSYYIKNKSVNIIIPVGAKYLTNIENILKAVGCTSDMYNYVIENEIDNKYELFFDVRFIETKHVEELSCYGIIFNTENGIIYYSGDTKETSVIKSLIEQNRKIDKLYIETTILNYPENVHLYIGLLEDTIPENLKNKVYCMHLDSNECINKVKKLGFNTVKIEK